MNLDQYRVSLLENMQRIQGLVGGVSLVQARWKPDLNSWSILEVVNHLLDEEKLDFRVRLEMTLHQPGMIWPAINPSLWVTEHKYNEKSLDVSIAGFMAAREDSLAWLGSLTNPNWQATYKATWGEIKAGDLMAAWVAHDLLHMRQLVELHWAYWAHSAIPFQTTYAGEW